MNVLFRCDASPLIGAGHVMRCLTLAKRMQLWGWNIHFCMTQESLETLPMLQEQNLALLPLQHPDDDTTAIPPYCTAHSIDLVIVDHYQRGIAFESALRDHVKSIAVIDDLADRAHDCDTLIDQTFARIAAEYEAHVPGTCHILTGTEYAILAPQYGALRNASIEKHTTTAEIRNILVSLGNANLHNCTGFVLDALPLYQGQALSINVVLGGTAHNLGGIKTQIDTINTNTPHQATLHISATNMHELMHHADFAIGAGGTTSWERCCLGLPSIMIEIADNQRFVSKALHDISAAHNLGVLSTVTPHDICNALTHYIDNPESAQKMAKTAATICNGRGADHILPHFIPATTLPNGTSLHLRFMQIEDTDTIYEWQSHPGLRQYSRNSAIPTVTEHKGWMVASLDNLSRYPYIILQDNVPAGIIRLDHVPDTTNRYEISILVAPNATKQGIASAAHDLLRRLHTNIEILAEIHPDNAASIALFRKLGYAPLSERQWLLSP